MNIDNVSVLGLDISKERTGIALLKGMNVLWYNYFSCPNEFKKVRVKDAEFSHYLHYYSKKIERIVKRCWRNRLYFTAIEDLNIRFAATAKVLLQLQAAAKVGICRATEGKCFPHLIHNKTIKSKFQITTGTSKEIKAIAKENRVTPIKVKMVDAVNKVFDLNLNYSQNDEADAIALSTTLLIKIQEGEIDYHDR